MYEFFKGSKISIVFTFEQAGWQTVTDLWARSGTVSISRVIGVLLATWEAQELAGFGITEEMAEKRTAWVQNTANRNARLRSALVQHFHTGPSWKTNRTFLKFSDNDYTTKDSLLDMLPYYCYSNSDKWLVGVNLPTSRIE